jgi:Protein of unknown function (DUF3108)
VIDRNATRKIQFTVFSMLLLAACTSSILKHEGSQEILKQEEFDRQFQVKNLEVESKSPAVGSTSAGPTAGSKNGSKTGPKTGQQTLEESQKAQPTEYPSGKSKKKKGKKGKADSSTVVAAAEASKDSSVHMPPEEDAEGFIGRRPKTDPFRVGEKVTLQVSYFGVEAGEMNLEVRPFVQVNGKKSYNFVGTAKSTSVFAMFYAVDDWFEAFVDYDTLTPSSYALHVKESKQLRETRCLFDWTKKLALFWDKKINAEQNVEEHKYEWEVPNYSQNIFTAAYYMRNFQLRPGKKINFIVAHEKENLSVTGEVLRREVLSTPVGDLNTLVIRPKIELNGFFKPVGEILFWLTDDERKFLVRIESKIKIGTIVTAVTAIQPGQAVASGN